MASRAERMDDGRAEPAGERPGGLWFGMLAGPLAFLVNLQVMFLMVPYACFHGWRTGLFAFPLAMAALSIGAAAVAWRNWQRNGREWPGEQGGPQPRSRFMAAVGVALSAMMLLVVVAHWLPVFFVDACQRG